MVQSVKFLAHEHEDPNSDPQHPGKESDVAVCTLSISVIQTTGEAETRGSLELTGQQPSGFHELRVQ